MPHRRQGSSKAEAGLMILDPEPEPFPGPEPTPLPGEPEVPE